MRVVLPCMEATLTYMLGVLPYMEARLTYPVHAGRVGRLQTAAFRHGGLLGCTDAIRLRMLANVVRTWATLPKSLTELDVSSNEIADAQVPSDENSARFGAVVLRRKCENVCCADDTRTGEYLPTAYLANSKNSHKLSSYHLLQYSTTVLALLYNPTTYYSPNTTVASYQLILGPLKPVASSLLSLSLRGNPFPMEGIRWSIIEGMLPRISLCDVRYWYRPTHCYAFPSPLTCHITRRMPYAMSGTDLPMPYAMSGTDLSYHPTHALCNVRY
eukprot:1248375-Rhodomonas_salina.3